ncbi:MAG: hypothetical protein JO113_03870, partial [Candidatus Eremiobacteraeota bacterium]|nr:hypothetical protein [Candidatus Eremiobacteraeota bacterium]
MIISSRRGFAFAPVLLWLAACNGNAGLTGVPAVPAASGPFARSPALQPLIDADVSWRRKIKHIVIVVQENRSFNDLFYGYPGATTAAYGYDSYG